MPSAEPVVRLQAVTAIRGDGSASVRVLDDVSLELHAGRTTSLVGASGSGKSTLLGVIAGLVRPESGSMFAAGTDITRLDEPGWARHRAEHLGVVLQRGNLIPFLDAFENVELATRFARGGGGRAERRARVAELLAALGLADRRHHFPRQLSGGEAQRVAIAVAMANDPRVLLVDEATGELDSANAEQVMELLFDAVRIRDVALFYVTHDRRLADRADVRLGLADGRIGPP